MVLSQSVFVKLTICIISLKNKLIYTNDIQQQIIETVDRIVVKLFLSRFSYKLCGGSNKKFSIVHFVEKYYWLKLC